MKKLKIKLFIHSDLVNEPVGPILLVGTDRVMDVESQVIAWLKNKLDANSMPDPASLKFLWSGKELEKDAVLYKVGIQNLNTIEMVVAKP
jgi:hypothetical protein